MLDGGIEVRPRRHERARMRRVILSLPGFSDE
jgi:hypothetical protein